MLSLRIVLIIFILIISAWLTFNIQRNQPQFSLEGDIAALPLDFDDWSGKELEVDREVKDILQTDNILIREYINSSGKVITLTIVYYRNSRTAFHLPESCLLGHGSRLTEKKVASLLDKSGKPFRVNELEIRQGTKEHIVLYYFETGKFRTSSYFDFRKKILLGKLKGNNTSGALVRFFIETDEVSAKADLKMLNQFISKFGGLITDRIK